MVEASTYCRFLDMVEGITHLRCNVFAPAVGSLCNRLRFHCKTHPSQVLWHASPLSRHRTGSC